MLNSPCGCSGTQPTIIVYEDGTAPPVVGNVVTLPNPGAEQVWAGIAGNGLMIVHSPSDGSFGHTPTISLSISPFTSIPMSFDGQGRLQVGPAPDSPAWLANGGDGITQGIRIVHAGALGHTPTIGIEVSPSSPVPASFDGQGRLQVGPVDVAAGQTPLVVNGGASPVGGISYAPGGPAGHEPTIGVSIDGTSTAVVSITPGGQLKIDQTQWTSPNSGAPLAGVLVTPGGTLGHGPSFAVVPSPLSTAPVSIDGLGRVRVDQDSWTSANATLADGVRVTPGGARGHSPSFAVVPSIDSTSRVFIGSDGGLAVDPPQPFKWELVSAGPPAGTYTVILRNTITGAGITLGTA